MGNEVSIIPWAVAMGNDDYVAPWVNGNEDISSEKREQEGMSTIISFCSCLVPFISEVGAIYKPVSSSLFLFPTVSEISLVPQ